MELSGYGKKLNCSPFSICLDLTKSFATYCLKLIDEAYNHDLWDMIKCKL